MRLIDFHSHFYPEDYIAAIEADPGAMTVTRDDQDNPVLHYTGDYNIAVPGHRDAEYRTGVLDPILPDEYVAVPEALFVEQLERKANRQRGREHELRNSHRQRDQASAAVEDGRVALVGLVQDRGRSAQ